MIFVLCYIVTIVEHESVTGYFYDSNISNFGDFLQTATGIGALVMTFLYSIAQRHKLIAAFHSLARTDEHLAEIGVEISYKKTLFRNYMVVLFQLIVLFSYFATTMSIVLISGFPFSITAWMSFMLPFMMISMITVLFVSLLNQSRCRFQQLNKVLCLMRNKTVDKVLLQFTNQHVNEQVKIQNPFGVSSVFSVKTNRQMPNVINRVASIQSEICDACDCVEDYFKVQMLTIVAISFLISVFDWYYILETIFTDDHTDSRFSRLQFVAFFLYQGLMHVIVVIKIVIFASLAVQEVMLRI